ncbi:hypothetical protein JHK85_011701 [Glycine max]|nr:hypothetical protein JHK85_011701 [Glycine max]
MLKASSLSFLVAMPSATASFGFFFCRQRLSSSFPFPPRPRLLSTTPTPYPLQYELIINRPSYPDSPRPPPARPIDSPEPELNKAQRKYYNKRRKRMYGSDEDESRRPDETFVELKPEVVDFPTLHKREEELYFYDAFTYPWEKDKHYKMVYQLEKKYFPDQCLDKAFLQPGQSNANANANANGKGKGRKKVVGGGGGDEKLVFFEEGNVEEKGEESGSGSRQLKEKKVEDFFKGLKKDPSPSLNKDVQVGEPFLSSRRTGLPPVWDTPHGTVLLVIQREPWEHIKDEDIKRNALSFSGEIWQVPPMFSAIKVGGEKMYEKARRGESIELSPRRISIFQFDIERSLDDR